MYVSKDFVERNGKREEEVAEVWEEGVWEYEGVGEVGEVSWVAG
jgi:hypothetical protein